MWPKSPKNDTAPQIKSTLDPLAPGVWTVDHHYENLIQEIATGHLSLPAGVQDPADVEKGDGLQKYQRVFRISFAEMQRMHLRKLQIKLIKHAVDMRVSKQESDRWEDELAQYIQAMKDYDYMRECTQRPPDYFVATGERFVDRYVMGKVIGDPDRLGDLEKVLPIGPWESYKKATPIGSTRHRMTRKMWWVGLRDRGLLAALAAVFLLGPMWLMVLHETIYTGLITTTVCVFVFGSVASVWLEKPIDVISATAAYAAVLVVFQTQLEAMSKQRRELVDAIELVE
ncbi:hypothetical protein VPNG_03591 [Cytospora leucostoma]|uniref:DUF6594 domain-containing protein n=1 Tax=Cytospora leucostoma TaxID=1230097 RepID=A0A423XD62_9PEZI|nr:hypothetical protein VPNG_03591 [Cytospora leucostoma]